MTEFLEPFENLIYERTGTSREWARSIALTSLSTAVGENMTFVTEVGPLKLNLYFLNIGASGLSRKSIPLNYYFKPIFRRLRQRMNKKFLFPSSFTSEGLHEYLTEKEIVTPEGVLGTQTSGCILRDEFTELVKETQGKKYMMGMLEFLAKLYDCEVPSRYTKNDKYLAAVQVCVNLISASTYHFLTIAGDKFYIQGLGNRFLYLHSGSGTVERVQEDDYFNPELKIPEKFVEKFVDKLKMYRDNTKGRIFLIMPKARKMLGGYKYNKERESQILVKKDKFDLKYSYMVRLPEFCFKITGLHAIDREGGREWTSDKEEVVNVTVEDVEYGKKVVNQHYEHFVELLELREEIRREWRTRQRRLGPDDILAMIEEEGGYIKQVDLTRKAASRGIASSTKYDYIRILLHAGELVECVQERRHTPGPKPIYFVMIDVLEDWKKKFGECGKRNSEDVVS